MRWIKNGWKTGEGETVQNKDLWKMLLGDIELVAGFKHKIEF
jgi:ribonuclease HI